MTIELKEQSFKVGLPAKLVVANIRGKVEIIPTEDGVIKVAAHIHMDDGNPDYTEIAINQGRDGLVEAQVRTPLNTFGIFNRKPLRVDFKIEAPVQTDIRARVVSGPISAHGFEGALDFSSVSGSVSVDDLHGALDLDSVSGKVTGKNLKGSAKVSVVSGRIDLEGCDFTVLKASTVSGKARIETRFGAGPYKLSAVSGSLLLVVPEDTGCEVRASAVSGRFYTDLDVTHSEVSRRKWHVNIRDGGPAVHMKTVSGKMQLLSSPDARGSVPGEVRKTQDERKDVLGRLSDGEISVDEALKELAT
jgi:DUF4097 and DUF4098 domain-containing protein YvlB